MTNSIFSTTKLDKIGALTLILSCFFVPNRLLAQRDTIISRTIDQVTVQGQRSTSNVKTTRDGTTKLSVEYLSSLPKIMGNADPVHYIQMMPGVQTNSEYDSGIHIQGCDNTHNFISIDGAPIYNAGHLLGFFSVFNPEHFTSVAIDKTPRKSDFPNRLGGRINMTPNAEIADSMSFAAEMGLISSQGALKIPVGKKQTLMLAARSSYLNLLYSNWLKIDESALRYSFSDFNVRYIFHSDNRKKIYLDLYHGNDNLKTDGSVGLSLNWGNDMAALHFDFSRYIKNNCIVYFSRYHNNVDFSFNDATANMPSDISTFGIKNKTKIKHFLFGIDAAIHNILPQTPQSDYNDISLHTATTRLNTVEANIFVDFEKRISPKIQFVAGCRGGVYVDFDGNAHLSIDPNASIIQTLGNTEISLSYAARHQNIFQTGCSAVSLPIEFWYASSKSQKPQFSHGVTLAMQSLMFQSKISLNAECYYKLMKNQTEYNGTLLDLVTSDYDINQNLISSRGHNYGFSLMINKRTGKLKGWIGYSYGRAWRKSEIQEPRFPATHERPHELNVVATYTPFSRVEFGATFVFASGTPFTSPDYFYLLNGNLMMQYGNHNANRLRPYLRLDASANIRMHQNKRFSDGINISVYNLSGRSNDIFYTLKYYNNEFKYFHVTFLVRFLPNISYYIKF